jgi:membrane protein YqaA with SNARE-associated domain
VKQVLQTLVAWGPLGLFIFAIIDGAGLPTPAGLDALFLLLTANRPQSAYFFAAITLPGSLLGCMILFYIARKGGEAILHKYRRRPRFIRFELWFQRYGLLTVFIPALVPIIPLPLKFFILCAGVFEVAPIAVFLTLLAARTPRYFALAYLGRKLGTESYPWLTAHIPYLLAAALVLFVFLYVLVVFTEKRRRKLTDLHLM